MTGIATAIRIPNTDPNPLIMNASSKNWYKISWCLAPMAFRIPISRVRSCTVTSMMFMIPMPLTSSAMNPISSRTMVSARAILRAASRMELRFCTE